MRHGLLEFYDWRVESGHVKKFISGRRLQYGVHSEGFVLGTIVVCIPWNNRHG
jgi:hypothetical protein